MAAVSAMVVGSIWYGPLFGKMWMHLQGWSREDIEKGKAQGMGKVYALGFVSAFVTAYVLAHLSVLVGVDSFGEGGWQLAFWSWLGLMAPVSFASYLWEGKPLKLVLLYAGNNLVTVLVMVAILASW